MALTPDKLSDSQKEIARLVGDEAVKQGVDPDFAIAQAYQESRLSHNKGDSVLTSSQNALGVMQVTPDTGKLHGFSIDDLKTPEGNIRAGVSLMKSYLDKYKDPAVALMAYHQGPGTANKYAETGDINVFGPKGKDYVMKIGDNYDLQNNTGLFTESAPQAPAEVQQMAAQPQAQQPQDLNWAGTGPTTFYKDPIGSVGQYFGSGDIGTVFRALTDTELKEKARANVDAEHGKDFSKTDFIKYNQAFNTEYSKLLDERRSKAAAAGEDTTVQGMAKTIGSGLLEMGKNAVTHPYDTARAMAYELGKDPELLLMPQGALVKAAEKAYEAGKIGKMARVAAKSTEMGATGAAANLTKQLAEVHLGERKEIDPSEAVNDFVSWAAMDAVTHGVKAPFEPKSPKALKAAGEEPPVTPEVPPAPPPAGEAPPAGEVPTGEAPPGTGSQNIPGMIKEFESGVDVPHHPGVYGPEVPAEVPPVAETPVEPPKVPEVPVEPPKPYVPEIGHQVEVTWHNPGEGKPKTQIGEIVAQPDGTPLLQIKHGESADGTPTYVHLPIDSPAFEIKPIKAPEVPPVKPEAPEPPHIPTGEPPKGPKTDKIPAPAALPVIETGKLERPVVPPKPEEALPVETPYQYDAGNKAFAEKNISKDQAVEPWMKVSPKLHLYDLPGFAYKAAAQAAKIDDAGNISFSPKEVKTITNQVRQFNKSSAEAEWNKINAEPFKQLPGAVQFDLENIRKNEGTLTSENVMPVMPHVLKMHFDKMAAREKAFPAFEEHINRPREEYSIHPGYMKATKSTPYGRVTDYIKNQTHVGGALQVVRDKLIEDGGKYFRYTPEKTAYAINLIDQLMRSDAVNKTHLYVPKFEIREKRSNPKSRIYGYYYGPENVLHMHPHEMYAHELDTLLHESVHAATVHALREHMEFTHNNTNGRAITPLGEDFLKIFAASKKGAAGRSHYGHGNVKEMVAEAFSNPDFIKHLMSLPSVLTKTAGAKLWDDFKSLVKKAVGIKDGTALERSLYDDLMDSSHSIFTGKTVQGHMREKAGYFGSSAFKDGMPDAVYGTGQKNIHGQDVSPEWEHPLKDATGVKSKVEEYIFKFQDNLRDLKLIQQEITRTGKTIDETFNPYEKEQTFHGRVATKIRDFLLKDVKPAVKMMEQEGITPAEINTYLHMRHAEERNLQMNEINPDYKDPITKQMIQNPLKDQGSGIHTDEARSYLSSLDPAKRAKLEKVAKEFDRMVKDTQEVLVKSGDVSPDIVSKWNETYKHYVPLRREHEAEQGLAGTGKGMAARGPYGKRALGSMRNVDDVIGNIIGNYERAVIRAEKMEVQKAVYGLALHNPNPGFWLPVNPDALRNPEKLIQELRDMGIDQPEDIVKNLMAEPKERYLRKVSPKEQAYDDEGLPISNGSKEVVANRINAMNRYKDNVFSVRINGKDRYVFFNPHDEAAMRIAKSLQNMNGDELNGFLKASNSYVQWFKNVNTQYNPIFGIKNLIRDTKGAMYNLSTTALAGKQKEVAAGIVPAMNGIIKVLRNERKGILNTQGEWADLYRDFREHGGQAGHRDSLIRRQDDMKLAEELLNKTKEGNARKAFGHVLNALTDFNDMMENSVRLSAYKAALDKGLSKHEAAIIAKNLTVNFDKRGAMSRQMNSLWAFFNASVQGSARIMQTLKGPAGKKIMLGGLALGGMQSILLAAAGIDEDDIPEPIKAKNFVIPVGGEGKYLTIPYPLGFNIFPNLSRNASEFAISGFRNPGKHLSNGISSIADAFNPLGSSGLLSFAPTITHIPLSLMANKDEFGRPIHREDRATSPTPGWERSRDNANVVAQMLAYGINAITSGFEPHSKGLWSPTAEDIQYTAGQLTGGVGREIMKGAEVTKTAAASEDVPAHRIPLVGNFYGEAHSPSAVASKFYENVTKLADHENVIKGKQQDKESPSQYYRDHPEAKLWKTANNIENQINALNKRKHILMQNNAKKEALQAIENQKTVIMDRFNKKLKLIQEQ